jgi:3'(2'), 5'-bisphosphate nucleotidase
MACRIQAEMVGRGLTKGDRSPVTVADFAVQALVARRLAEQLPGDALVGEENADRLRLDEGVATLDQITRFVRSEIAGATPEDVCNLIDRGTGDPPATFWTLDPIDGTKGFLRREQYAVALALIRDGLPWLCALGCPELTGLGQSTSSRVGTLIVAGIGHGAYCQPLHGASDWKKLRVSERSKPTEARILRSVEKAHTNVDEIGQLASKLGTTESPVGMDSQAKYAVLAAGGGDIMLRLLSPSQPD